MRIARTFTVILAVQLATAAVGWTQTSQPLRDRIPKPDAAKYQHVQDGQDWKNPVLVVRRGGIEIVGVTPVEPGIAVESVATELERLPDSAWPYGLVVAVEDAGIVSQGDEPLINANRAKLLALLKKLGIVAALWPSA